MIVESAEQGKQVWGLTKANGLGTKPALNKTPIDSIATRAQVYVPTSDALVDYFHHFAYHLAIASAIVTWRPGYA